MICGQIAIATNNTVHHGAAIKLHPLCDGPVLSPAEHVWGSCQILRLPEVGFYTTHVTFKIDVEAAVCFLSAYADRLYSMCAHSGALKRFYHTCVKMTIRLFDLVVAISTIINLFLFPNYFVALSQY